ncbi:MAG: CoB--CoM heterodisulfide reductase iron-sulfur subunit A family protein [Gemmatimonadota bacterium]
MTEPKTGAFICRCGGNISDYVDAERVCAAAAGQEGVATARTFMFACSDASQQEMVDAIRQEGLDRIVIASCSPKLHLNTFRAMAARAGLNPYMYTQVNIREQCSWAHRHEPDAATEKAVRLVGAGIAKARRDRPLSDVRVDTIPSALVIGAGVAGMRAALALSDLGLSVHLVEKSAEVGGRVGAWGRLFPDDRDGAQTVATLLDRVRQRENITLFTDAEVVEKSGSVGNFSLEVSVRGQETVSLQVGAIVVATGFDPYEPRDGELGSGLPGVVTLPEFKEMLAGSTGRLRHAGRDVKTIVYVYCVGSRRKEGEGTAEPNRYCSRYCCSAAVHAAIQARGIDPGIDQYHLYRDMRTYGRNEVLFEQAGRNGSVFLKFSEECPPEIRDAGGGLAVRVRDELLGGEAIDIPADLVVLVTGMVPRENARLQAALKLPVARGGFFNEIHPKLRPVETVIDGVFIAGAAQGPKTLAESVTSAMAAVAKSAGLLMKGYVDLSPLVAVVDPDACAWCGECAAACPYDGAIEKIPVAGKEIAAVVPALCKGCGGCVPVCPADAIGVEGSTTAQVTAMIDALAGTAAT